MICSQEGTQDLEQELPLVVEEAQEVAMVSPRSFTLLFARRMIVPTLVLIAVLVIGLRLGWTPVPLTANFRHATGFASTSSHAVSYHTMQATAFTKYPGYDGDMSCNGVVTINNCETTSNQEFDWVLGLQGSAALGCGTTQQGYVTNACGMQITEGVSCSVQTGQTYCAGSSNAYSTITYVASSYNGQVASIGMQKSIASGYTGRELNGKTLILFDHAGKRAGCAVIAPQVLHSSPSCFPGDASATVEGHGDVRLSDIKPGDSVLVQHASGKLDFEPLLGFLHTTTGLSRYLSVEHALGKLRVSPNHLVFLADGAPKLAGELQVGDKVLAFLDGKSRKAVHSVVTSVRIVSGEFGMVAPLTMAGSIVVDGTVASVYATHSAAAFVPHCVLHALFFPARVLSRVSLGTWATGPSPKSVIAEGMHPLARFYEQVLLPFGKAMLSL